MNRRSFVHHGPTGTELHPTLKCQRCRINLPRETRQQLFRDERGGLEYHPLDMAQFIAGAKFKVLAEDIVEFHASARGSKRGLVTGFSYVTQAWGHDGEGKFCGLGCATDAAIKAARRGAGGLGIPAGRQAAEVAAAQTVAEPGAAGKPPLVTGEVLRQIRKGLGLPQHEFATLLGFGGTLKARMILISRYERGRRRIAPAVQRLAWAYRQQGRP